jgi:hypothetical protein
MHVTAPGFIALCIFGLAGCAELPAETQDAAPRPIGPSFTFDRYSHPAYYQFVLAKNDGGRLSLCSASIIVEDLRNPGPTPYLGEAEFSGSIKVRLDFTKRYYAPQSSDLGQALLHVNASASLPESLRSEIAKLPANCVTTRTTWRDDFREPKLSGDDWSLLVKHRQVPHNGMVEPVPKSS